MARGLMAVEVSSPGALWGGALMQVMDKAAARRLVWQAIRYTVPQHLCALPALLTLAETLTRLGVASVGAHLGARLAQWPRRPRNLGVIPEPMRRHCQCLRVREART